MATLTPWSASSAPAGALRRELEGRCPKSFAATVASFRPLEETRGHPSQVAATGPGLEEPILTLRGTLVRARNSDGLYIDDVAAGHLKAGPGSSLELLLPNGTVSLGVAG